MKNNTGAQLELLEILKIIKRRFYIIIMITLPIVLFVNYYIVGRMKPYYTARIGLIVGNTIDSNEAYDIQKVSDYERFMETYCALVKSSIVMDNASKRLNNTVPSSEIQSSILATPETGTQFMYLSISWSNSSQTKQILTAVSDAFIEEAKGIYPTCNIKIIEKIKEPAEVMPDKKKYLIVALAGGIVISILIIFGIELFDNKIKTEEDIEENLSIPVFAQIPRNKKKLTAINLNSINSLNYGIIEAYRTLRTSIEFASTYRNIKAIAVTSGKPGEGKSTTAAMLAVVMAKAGKRTIIIDCDLRKPSMHKLFNLVNSPGLTNFLAVDARLREVIRKSEIENLYLVTVGTVPPNPAELLSSIKMKGFIEVLKDSFDSIIIDTPPIALVADAQILAQYADGCLFIVASGEAVKEETIKAKHLIESVNGNILGSALNKVKRHAAYGRYNYYYSAIPKKRRKHLFKFLYRRQQG